MEQFNPWMEPQDGYQLPPNVVMNGQAPIAPAPMPAPPPKPSREVPAALPPHLALARSPLGGAQASPLPQLQTPRPWWFPLALVGIPSGSVLVLGVAAIVMSNSPNAVTTQLAATNSAAVMAGMKNRTNVTVTCGLSCWGLDTAALTQQQETAPPAPAVAPAAVALPIDGAGLNLYHGDRVINTIPAGDGLRIIQSQGDWIQVEWIGAGGLIGWVQSQGVSL